MGVQCWTRLVTNSFKNCSHSSLHSGLCARWGHYASIWCHCCIKYSKCESLKQFHRKAPPGILEYRVYHKSYAKCEQDKWHGMHVSNFTQNTTWKKQIISLFENTFKKRLIAIKNLLSPEMWCNVLLQKSANVSKKPAPPSPAPEKEAAGFLPECWYPCIRSHDITFQKTGIFSHQCENLSIVYHFSPHMLN